MTDIRFPNITATTEKGQLEQIRSYLYQFAQQLNWALSNIDNKAEEAKQKMEAASKPKNEVEQAQATFSEVKSLIIKSADIVNAYYEEISHRLEGVYVAQSDFGVYQQETSATLEANSTNINLLFENNQAIATDMEGLAESVGKATADVEEMGGRVSNVEGSVETIEGDVSSVVDSVNQVSADVAGVGDAVSKLTTDVESVSGNVESLEGDMDGVKGDLDNLSNDVTGMGENLSTINGAIHTDSESTTIIGSQAWCKIGVLTYGDNGFPIYGMEIGQVNTEGEETVYKQFAQYRSDGVHLFDQNGIEVATISDYKLRITNAEMINAVITNSLVLGGYEVTTANGLAFKWKGRGNG